MNNMNSRFLTLVIRQPEDFEARGELMTALQCLMASHGAEITGMSQEDEMTLCEFLQERLDPFKVEEARREVAALHARTGGEGIQEVPHG
ncbi:hypothetical protein [Azotobacter vinelandii]|uniref:hypothetical protein n=1 Tax=Azotobacter vinelandii TaxID=354 RepID=UPI0007745EA8|nr:hypothetical protein [Azotobacter vinelandii]